MFISVADRQENCYFMHRMYVHRAYNMTLHFYIKRELHNIVHVLVLSTTYIQLGRRLNSKTTRIMFSIRLYWFYI